MKVGEIVVKDGVRFFVEDIIDFDEGAYATCSECGAELRLVETILVSVNTDPELGVVAAETAEAFWCPGCEEIVLVESGPAWPYV